MPVVTVFCDDTHAAVSYFEQIKRHVKAKVTVVVHGAPCRGVSADKLIQHVTEQMHTADVDEADDTFWVLLDTESEPHKQKMAESARQQAQGKAFEVVLSKPCFEVWTLAHLVDTGGAFDGCAAVLARVKTEWKRVFESDLGPKKGQADYSKLIPLIDRAIASAKRRREGQDQSWTEVWRVANAIMSLFRS